MAEIIVDQIDPRYRENEELLNKIKELSKAAKIKLGKRFEVIVFIETNIPTQTKLSVDYEIS